ncbi:MAG: ectonucleotide pyrophosphatase/phosphodiesterase, partial [Bacteroides sp.]|nr:ectonucleotide pyrophosphatase/phosphodiesterase [Bacteroides sp.]
MKTFTRLSVITFFLFVACTFWGYEQNYTVIVSLDGFRHDYPRIHQTPELDKIAASGVDAVMLPSYPASTFPNHYTMATGLVPDHHGIVNNSFWDPVTGKRYSMGDNETRYDATYYLGEPIWITAERQGVKTGVLYWVGCDIPGLEPFATHLERWDPDERLTFQQRIDKAIEWLSLPEETRPRLIMLYIEEPDGYGHRYGPTGKETGKLVKSLDALMGDLYRKISALPHGDRVNLIVTSDHGMTDISSDRMVDVFSRLRPEWYEKEDGRNPLLLFTKPQHREQVYQTLKKLKHIYVWKKEEIPAELNYGTSVRIGDIVVAPHPGWQLGDKPFTTKGAHGYSPHFTDMQVMFRGTGPDFKEGYLSAPFVNTDLYPLLAH